MSSGKGTISADILEDVLLCCRYGELDELEEHAKNFGQHVLEVARDENRNTVIHMAAGNGHDDILEYILPLVEPSLLSTANSSLSTPLHWAALNSHLKAMQLLVEFPSGPQADLIDQKNSAGRTPLGEAEMAGWEEGAQYLVSKMKLDETTAGDGEATAEADEVLTGDIEVEIEDADGQIARMKLDGSSSSSATAPPPTTTSG